MNDFNHYQDKARETAIYPKNYAVTYPLLGLTGEVGEFANKYKKVIRDGKGMKREDTVSELGDVLWYLSNLAFDLNISLDEIAAKNLEKLQDRAKRGKIKGSGDNR